MNNHWEHENWRMRRKAVKEIEDLVLLMKIAKNDDNEKVRKAALKKIDDQDFLAWVIQNDKHWIVRELALKKLDTAKYQNLLEEIAQDDDEFIRHKAIKKLSKLTGKPRKRRISRLPPF